MQIVRQFKNIPFKPVEVKLVFETPEELGEFYSIFNYSPITECLAYLDPTRIRQELAVPYSVYSESHARLNSKLDRREL